MKWLIIFAAVAEAATGLGLLIVPSLVGQLLLGEQLTGVGDRLLARSAACRHAELQRIGHAVSGLPGPRR